MQTKITLLTNQLKELFTGQPWYGKPVMEILDGITHKMAFRKPDEQSHSIMDIAAHVAQWQWFVVEKLKGNKDFDVDNVHVKDWPVTDPDNSDAREKVFKKIITTKDQIIDELGKKEDTFLDQIVPKRNYNYEYLLQGIIQHDIYHIGQIALLKNICAN